MGEPLTVRASKAGYKSADVVVGPVVDDPQGVPTPDRVQIRLERIQ